MTFRAYLTLLRPVRTLLFAAFYTWAMGFNMLKSLGGQTMQEALFLTFAILGPVILGSFCLGPLHELMHRNCSALIPGLRLALRRRHLIVCGILAASFLVAAACTRFPFPIEATLGLILASLTMPLLNRRSTVYSSSFFGMVGYIPLLALLAFSPRLLLLDAGRACPWAFLIAGIAITALCIRSGFSEKNVRERSRSQHLVYCFQTAMPFLGSGGLAITRYAQAENGRALAARKADRRGRDWTVASVGASLREWAAVVHHCRFGGGSLKQAILGWLIIGASPLLMLAVIQFFISRAEPNNPISFSATCALLAAAFRPGATPDLIATLLYVFSLVFGLIAAASFTAPVVLAPYRLPISRERLARSTLLETHRLNALIAAAFAAELGTLTIGATLLAGQSLDLSLFARPLAATLFLFPAAFLIQAFIVSAARRYWLLIAGFAVPTLVGPGIAGAIAARLGARAPQYSPVVLLDAVFTPAGLAIFLAISATAVALHRLALRRHFRTCDFSRPVLLVAAGRSA
jgi:hypothetical protein